MSLSLLRRCGLAAVVMLLCGPGVADVLDHPDHAEFNATLDAPFQARGGRYPIRLDFAYPYSSDAVASAWTLQAIAPDGRVVRRWQGITPFNGHRGQVRLDWDGRGEAGEPLAAGYYTLRLRAVPAMDQAPDAARSEDERIAMSLAAFAEETIEQDFDVMVGAVRAAAGRPMRPLRTGGGDRLAATATQDGAVSAQSVAVESGLPYTIYFGNFHAQTNHSDGGGDLSTCTSSQGPQNGAFGPADAYAMMHTRAGGDFLLNSEHNHMYDGSTSTATSASPATAIALFDSGLQAAANYRAANPSFMALYGLEWGVISNGGHLNIVNADALPNWEFNSAGQLIGEVETPKSDYPALYAVMRARGWIGQFNHPATTGQFLVGGVPLGYDANGAEVMVMAEVLNSSAFSTNTTETETSRSSYVGAWNKLLEAGYRVAPSTNQDNHCANWGLSFTNRTGVLLPDTAALGTASFTDALRARRVFATEDRTGQLVLTGNGRVMGESFANSGALTLTANYASTAGKTVQRVQFFQGVPGRNGTVTQLAEGSTTHSFTPADGEHFYYALVTQSDGLRLWSAPVWVSQGSAPADTTPPTVSASASGSSGSITLSASASDNVGVVRVEFLVDGALVGSDTVAPYAVAFDSTTVANGSHTLTARAFDAAGNSATSAGVAFSVDNAAPADTTAPTVSASTAGGSGSITLSASASDNVGVTLVDFYVDGVLRGSDAAAPYAIAFDSTTVADGSHSLTAVAFDAAGNSATSAAVAFTVSNTAPAVERVANGGFESGKTGWTASNGVITKNSTYPARSGTWKAWLNGYGSANTEFVYQSVAIPSAASTATLSFWVRVDSDETTTTTAWDTLKVQLRNGSNGVIATLATYSNLDKGSTYVQRSFDVSAYRGQTVRVYFEGVEGSQVATSFLLDDVSLQTR